MLRACAPDTTERNKQMELEQFTPGIFYVNGTVTPLVQPLKGGALCEAVGAENPELVIIDGGLDLWFDGDAQAKGKPLNEEATRIQHACYSSFEQQDIYGDAVLQPM